MRLGVAAALVDGKLLLGDVAVDDGIVTALGVGGGGGRGIAAPGFVDLQVNGFAGVDFQAADAEATRAPARRCWRTGVTAFQPTFITAPEVDLAAALAAMPVEGCGPRVIGAHLEGPFLSPQRLGAHDAEGCSAPDLALLRRLLEAGPVSADDARARAARRLRAHRRAGRARGHGVLRALRRDRRRGAPGLRSRRAHGHPPVQRDAPERPARSGDRHGRARARRRDGAGHRRRPPTGRRDRARRLAGGARALRPGQRRGGRGGHGRRALRLGGTEVTAEGGVVRGPTGRWPAAR